MSEELELLHKAYQNAVNKDRKLGHTLWIRGDYRDGEYRLFRHKDNDHESVEVLLVSAGEGVVIEPQMDFRFYLLCLAVQKELLDLL